MFQQTDKKYGFETLILVEYFKIHFYTNKYLLSLRTFYEALLIIHNKSLFLFFFMLLQFSSHVAKQPLLSRYKSILRETGS